MNWKKITEANLVAALSRREIETYRRDFEVDTVEQLITDLTGEIRGYIFSNGNVRMDPDETTIPASCIPKAVAILVIRVLSRINLQQTQIRIDNAKLAEEFFNNLAAGKGKVEDYDTPITDTTQQVATSPAFSAPKPERLLD